MSADVDAFLWCCCRTGLCCCGCRVVVHARIMHDAVLGDAGLLWLSPCKTCVQDMRANTSTAARCVCHGDLAEKHHAGSDTPAAHSGRGG